MALFDGFGRLNVGGGQALLKIVREEEAEHASITVTQTFVWEYRVCTQCPLGHYKKVLLEQILDYSR